MKTRRICLLIGLFAVLAGPSCSSRFEGTADLEGALAARIHKAVEPGASWVIPLRRIKGVGKMTARRVDLPDGGAVVALYSFDDDPFGQPLGSDATIFAHVAPDGKVTPIPASPEIVRLAYVFQVPPAVIPCGNDAIVLFCGAADNARSVRVSPSTATASISTLNAADLCPSANGWPKGVLGQATGDRFVLAHGDPGKVTLHTCDGDEVALAPWKDVIDQSSIAWAAEIGGGVFAWARAAYDFKVSNTIWTYHQSDRDDVLTTTGTDLPLAPPQYAAEYRDFGVPLFVREASGALVFTEGDALRRWHVESDGHVELVASKPAAPFGEWKQFAAGAWLAADVRENPNAPGLQTPSGWSLLSLQDNQFVTQSIRMSPCTDQDMCRRLGETFTLAVAGTGESAAVIQAFWPWELLGTGDSAGAVVAVRQGGSVASDGGPDSSADAGEDAATEASEASQDAVVDAWDGAQEDAPAACTLPCGDLGCDPLGGCNPESIATEPATAAVGSDVGVFWLAQPGVGGGYSRWLMGSNPVETLGSGEFYWTERSVMGQESDFAWSSAWGVHYRSPPALQPTTTLVLGVGVHHSAHPVGITATHVVAIAYDQGTPPLDRVHRYAKAALMTDELFACTEGATDATLDPSGQLLVTAQGALQLFKTPLGGTDCMSPTPAVVLADATQLSQAARVVAGSSLYFVAGTGSPGSPIYAVSESTQPPPVQIGTGAAFTFDAVAFRPLAVHASSGTVYYVDASPAEPGPPAKYRIVSVADVSNPIPKTVAIAHGPVSSLEVSEDHVYWTDSRGVLRAPR